MTAPASTTHRLIVAAPSAGWLTLADPAKASARLALARDWKDVTAASVRAAGLPRLYRVRVKATVRPDRVADTGQQGIRVAEDVRPTLHQVYDALTTAAVLPPYTAGWPVVAESLVLGVPTGPAGGQGYLVLEFTEEVAGG